MGTLGHERVGTAGLAISMRADLAAMVNLARSANPDALRWFSAIATHGLFAAGAREGLREVLPWAAPAPRSPR